MVTIICKIRKTDFPENEKKNLLTNTSSGKEKLSSLFLHFLLQILSFVVITVSLLYSELDLCLGYR